MYHTFFHLKENPFSMTADPGYVLWTPQHREAAAALMYGISSRKGLMVLTGGPGTGKTTMLSKVLQNLPKNEVSSAVVLNPTLTSRELLEMVLLDFGVREVPESKARRIWLLQKLLGDNHAAGRISLLAIDEAHKLSHELLEEVRLLGNFDRFDAKLLQVVLLGQPELDDILNRENLGQFKQRIALRLTIGPLQERMLQRYIQFRWQKAGGESSPPFTAETIAVIGRYSRCVPRLINSICDNALLLAFAEGAAVVTEKHVEEACRDLHLKPAIKAGSVSSPSVTMNSSADPAPTPPNAPALVAPVAVPARTPLPETLRPDLALRTLTTQAARSSEPMFLARWKEIFWPRRTQTQKL